MDVYEAVEIAKSYVAKLYDEEHIKEIGLEEVELQGNSWLVTVGFTRVWPTSRGVLGTLSGTGRTYKQLCIDDDMREVKSLRHRDVSNSSLSDA